MKKYIFVVIICSILIGCNSKAAFDYSQNFVAKETILVPKINTVEEKIAVFVENKQFDSIAISAKTIEDEVEQIIADVKKQPAPDAKEAEKFKAAIINYFSYIKSIYTIYIQYGTATDDEARNDAVVKLQDVVAKKDAALNNIKTVQKSFAAANGFKIAN